MTYARAAHCCSWGPVRTKGWRMAKGCWWVCREGPSDGTGRLTKERFAPATAEAAQRHALTTVAAKPRGATLWSSRRARALTCIRRHPPEQLASQ